MKLTSKVLKNMIQEVIKESKGNSMILFEATQWTKYQRVVDMLKGDIEAVDEISILTPENPHAKPTPDFNDARQNLFHQDMKSAGFGLRSIGGMYGGPEDSYVIPHMSVDEAARIAKKYGQESFVYSVKQDADKPMLHQMHVVDFTNAQQDPRFPVEEYGAIYHVPPGQPVKTTVETESNDVQEFFDLIGASDYYSYIPGKGEKEDLKTKIDFYSDKPVVKGDPQKPPGSGPRYVRESFQPISVKEAKSSQNPEVKELTESIQSRVSKIQESERLGGSKMHHRQMILREKKRLSEILRRK